MTSHQSRKNDTNHAVPAETPRLRLKPKAPSQGRVDGAWWPQTGDLAAELPDLLAVLSVRLGRIDRVLYNLKEWPEPPRKLVTGVRAVRLDGYMRQPVGTIEILGLGGERLILLVIPSDEQPESAHRTMMAAAHPADTAADPHADEPEAAGSPSMAVVGS